MSSIDTDVNIILNAEDNASATVDQATKRINTSFNKMQAQNKALTRSWDLQHQSLFKTMQVMRSLGSIATRSLGVFNSLLLMQIRNGQTARNLRDAIRDANEAYREFGPASEQYSKAMENVKDIQEDMKNETIQNTLQYATMATVILTSVVPALNKVVGRLNLLKKASITSTPAKTPIGTPTPGVTSPKTTPTPKSLGGGLRGAGRFAAGVAAKASGPIAAVQLASMLGEQQAGETSIPSGAEAIGEIANVTINVVVKSAQDALSAVRDAFGKAGVLGQ